MRSQVVLRLIERNGSLAYEAAPEKGWWRWLRQAARRFRAPRVVASAPRGSDGPEEYFPPAGLTGGGRFLE